MIDSFMKTKNYNIMSVIMSPQSPVSFPWHSAKRRRLQCGMLHSLDTSRWIMIEPGLDDFRRGAPDSEKGRIIPIRKDVHYITSMLQSRKNTLPIRTNMLPSSVTDSTSLGRQRKKELAHSGQTMLDDFQNDPMVLLPVLEGTLPHDIFQKLCEMIHKPENVMLTSKQTVLKESVSTPVLTHTSASILERKKTVKLFPSTYIIPAIEKPMKSSMSVKKETELTVSDQQSQKQSTADTDSSLGLIRSSQVSMKTDTMDSLDPFRKFLKSRIGTAEKKKKKKPRAQIELPYQDMAEEFCKWASELEGDQEDALHFDPEMLMNLFAVNRDYSVCAHTDIKILDELNVPEVLTKLDTYITRKSKIRKAPTFKKQKMKSQFRYGAWYLSVDKWKKQRMDEKTLDPDELKKEETLKLTLTNPRLNESLRNLYSTKVFREYLQTAKIKMPHFMKDIPLPNPDTSKSCHSCRSD